MTDHATPRLTQDFETFVELRSDADLEDLNIRRRDFQAFKLLVAGALCETRGHVFPDRAAEMLLSAVDAAREEVSGGCDGLEVEVEAATVEVMMAEVWVV